jgi:hypothetical protein
MNFVAIRLKKSKSSICNAEKTKIELVKAKGNTNVLLEMLKSMY